MDEVYVEKPKDTSMFRRIAEALSGAGERFRGVDPATGEADYWKRGGLAGVLGMPSALEQSPQDIAMSFAGATTPAKAALDFSSMSLTQAAKEIAKLAGAKKTGQGKLYAEGGRRVYDGPGGERSRYYRLPDGRELRISNHADVSGSPANLDLVLDPEYGQATVKHYKPGTSTKTIEPSWFERDQDAVSKNIHGEPIAGESVFNGDGAAWSAALLQRLRELGALK